MVPRAFLLFFVLLVLSGSVLAMEILAEKDSLQPEGMLEHFKELNNGKTFVSVVFEKMNHLKLYDNKTNEWASTSVDGAVITDSRETSYEGKKVIVGFARDFVPERDTGKIYVLTMEGVGAEGWHLRGDPTTIRGYTLKGDVVAGAIEDVDGDGEKDIIVLTELNYIYGISLDASAVWSIPSIPLSTALKQAKEIILADLDNDGKKDVVLGTGNSLFNLSLSTGKHQDWKKFQLSDTKNNINSIAYSEANKQIILGTDQGLASVDNRGEQQWIKEIGKIEKVLIKGNDIYASGREGTKKFGFDGTEKASWGESIDKMAEGLGGILVSKGSNITLLDYNLKEEAEGVFPEAIILKSDSIGTENKIIYLQKEKKVAEEDGIEEVDGEPGEGPVPGVGEDEVSQIGKGFFERLSLWQAVLILIVIIGILIVVVLILKSL